jgi:hypothetical protein
MGSPNNPGWAAQQAAQQSQQAAQQAAYQSSQAAQRAAQQANQQQFLLNGQLAAQRAAQHSARRAANGYPRRGNRAGGCLGTLMLLVIAAGAVVLLAHNPGILHTIAHQLNATQTP